jgi:hypothetical protein
VVPRTGLDDMEIRKFFPLPGLELRLLGPPVRNKSLYRLRCPSCLVNTVSNPNPAYITSSVHVIGNVEASDTMNRSFVIQFDILSYLLGYIYIWQFCVRLSSVLLSVWPFYSRPVALEGISSICPDQTACLALRIYRWPDPCLIPD